MRDEGCSGGPSRSSAQGGRAMVEYTEAFVGIDAAKSRNAIAIAEAGREGEIRYLGEVDATPQSMRKVVARLAAKYQRLHFCYEAGPTGYGLYRQLTALGHDCIVVAPSLIPRKPGVRVKTDRRDAISLARLLRAGELTPVWVPDEAHEALRDLVRARDAAVEDLRRKRQSATISIRFSRWRSTIQRSNWLGSSGNFAFVRSPFTTRSHAGQNPRIPPCRQPPRGGSS